MKNSKSETLDELLTVQDAATEAGVTEAAIRNAIYRERLAVIRKYGRMLIPRQLFEEYRKTASPGRPRTVKKK